MPKPSARIIRAIKKPRALAIPSVALRSVTSKSGLGVYASSDTLFKGAVFGRDSLEVAEDIMKFRPKLVRKILLTMVRLQGHDTNHNNEEEPGKIIHEYRNIRVDNKLIDQDLLKILNKLAAKWGGDEEDLAYYGSIDSTPHFLKVMGEYCALHGNDILSEMVTCRDGKLRSVRGAVNEATNWLLRQLTHSKSGLLEYHRKNPDGILNQVWKDSDEFYIHADGSPVNHDKPIASIEVQGLVFDGLLAAGQLLPSFETQCRQTAYEVRENIFNKFWLEDAKYFALGIDYSESGKSRRIETPTANPGALLDSKIFDNLPDELKQKYISSIITKLMSYEFLTSAGVRSRSIKSADLIDFWDYHGSFVSWPKETYDIAKGLRRQGFEELARQLENRLINVVLRHRQYPEFVYVDGWDRVLDSTPASHTHGDVTVVSSTNNPERVQAWTVSAILAITVDRLNNKLSISKKTKDNTWQNNLETEIMKSIPRINRHLNPLVLQARYPSNKYRLTEDDA